MEVDPANHLVGLPWADAEPWLAARGLNYRYWVTRPPAQPVGDGELRVVAVRTGASDITLILAHRTYLPHGPAGGASPDAASGAPTPPKGSDGLRV